MAEGNIEVKEEIVDRGALILTDEELSDIKDYYFGIIPCSERAQRERCWIIQLVREVEEWRRMKKK